MDFKKRQYTPEEVGRVADLDISTVKDWAVRGVVPVEDSARYSVMDALRFTAVHSLVGHGMAVYRAAETLRRIEDTQAKFWRAALDKCAAGAAHVYVYTAFYNSQAFGVFLYAGDSATADAYIQNSMADATSGELVDDSIEAADLITGAADRIAPGDTPFTRVARFDIGPDLRRAFRLIGL
jgi:hypothetical protein